MIGHIEAILRRNVSAMLVSLSRRGQAGLGRLSRVITAMTSRPLPGTGHEGRGPAQPGDHLRAARLSQSAARPVASRPSDTPLPRRSPE